MVRCREKRVSAMSRHWVGLFDHFVGAAEQREGCGVAHGSRTSGSPLTADASLRSNDWHFAPTADHAVI
jgi:hypothetical protein